MIDISVVISTHNRGEPLSKTINSVKAQDYAADRYEIIVVDNGSTDNTREIAMECGSIGKEIIYIFEPAIGLHNARHAGALAAQGEILVYTDDDVICDTKWLSALIKPYHDPEVACVGGKILPQWEQEPPEWIHKYSSALSLLDLGDEQIELQKPNIWGCNFSIRRDLLFEVGGFNPDAFGDRKLIWYRGDGECGLQRKILSIGKKIIYEPQALVWHIISKNRTTIEYLKKRYYIEGISACFKVWHKRKINHFELLIHICLFFTISIIAKSLAVIGKLAKQNWFIWLELISSMYYCRTLYEMRLMYDKNLQKHIKCEKWLT